VSETNMQQITKRCGDLGNLAPTVHDTVAGKRWENLVQVTTSRANEMGWHPDLVLHRERRRLGTMLEWDSRSFATANDQPFSSRPTNKRPVRFQLVRTTPQP
jgi:hypothetical protein